MVAYDYEAQRWVEGAAAEVLLAAQRAEDLELEQDPAYLAFIAKKSEPRGCGKCACPYCGNDEVDDDVRACCGEAHAFVCGERGVFCDECTEAA